MNAPDPGVLSPFRCDTCSEIHSGPVLDLGFKRPDPYLRLREEEKSRCRVSDDLCEIPRRSWHLHAVLKFPLTDHCDVAAIGLWCSVSEAAFRRYELLYSDSSQAAEPPFRGTLSTDMGILPETEGLAVEVRLVSARNRPDVRLLDSSHPLSRQQEKGITVQEWFQIRHAILGK